MTDLDDPDLAAPFSATRSARRPRASGNSLTQDKSQRRNSARCARDRQAVLPTERIAEARAYLAGGRVPLNQKPIRVPRRPRRRRSCGKAASSKKTSPRRNAGAQTHPLGHGRGTRKALSLIKMACGQEADRGELPQHDRRPWYKEWRLLCSSRCRHLYGPNADGVGDFTGLLRRLLDYLHGLGITSDRLMPFQASPGRDDRLTISGTITGVRPRYGTASADLSSHPWLPARGMRVIIDLVVNTPRIKHPGFRDARKSKDSPYREW